MSFNKQQFMRKPGDTEKELEKIENELAIKNDISDLKQFIKELQEERLKETATPKERKNIKLGIQMLICSYLDIIDNIPKIRNEKKAVLLSQILNTDGHENIRKRLSSIDALDSNKVRRKNLKYVYDLFEKLGMADIAKKVKSDLNSIAKV